MKHRVFALVAFCGAATIFLSACSATSTPGPSASSSPVIVTETAAPVTSTRVQESNSPVDTPTSTTVSPTISTPPSATTALPPLGTPDTAVKQRRPEGGDLSVTDVRLAEHDTFTRIVFDIAGNSSPGWWVDWTTDPLQQASGLPVDISGENFLDVNIEGIGYPGDAAGESVANGSFGGVGIVEDVQLTSIYEGRAQFLIGVSGPPRSYSVSLLENPTRVVVDIAH